MDLLPLVTILILVLLALATSALRRVPEDVALAVHRLGRYRRTLGPGWHLVLPLVDRMGNRVRLLGHHVEVRGSTGRCADAAIYYQILEPARAGAAIADTEALVGQEALARLHALAAEPGAANLAGLAVRLKEDLNRQLERTGLMVIRCQLHLPTL